MKSKIYSLFPFEKKHKGYQSLMMNEREVRASAGVLFLGAILSFMNVILLGNFLYVFKIFIAFFLVDFSIRLFINYRYSPSIIIGRLAVRNQQPEYVSAIPKRFAWFMGFWLSFVMFFVIVVFTIATPVNIVICLLCLAFLFCESVFGICIGCLVHNTLYGEKPEVCAGGICSVTIKDEVQKISAAQLLVVLVSAVCIVVIAMSGLMSNTISGSGMLLRNSAQGSCNTPQ